MRKPSLDLPPMQRQVEAWPMPAAAGDVALPFTQHARFDEHAEVDPAEWRLQILESIRYIDAASWDEVAGPHAASRSHAYLAAVEASGINDCRYFYPAIHDAANRLVAHACVYTITTDFLQMLPESLRGPASWLRRLWPCAYVRGRGACRSSCEPIASGRRGPRCHGGSAPPLQLTDN